MTFLDVSGKMMAPFHSISRSPINPSSGNADGQRIELVPDLGKTHHHRD